MSRVWAWRAVIVVALLVSVDVASVRLDFAPDHVRLTLLVLLSSAVVVLVWDSLGDSGPPWAAAGVRPMTVPGGDQRLAGYVRLIESHLTSAVPDAALRDRIAALCDERLAGRHALTRQDPAARELLGDDLLSDLSGPVRRLTRTEIARHLERIESL